MSTIGSDPIAWKTGRRFKKSSELKTETVQITSILEKVDQMVRQTTISGPFQHHFSFILQMILQTAPIYADG